jgi:hypothetical protein
LHNGQLDTGAQTSATTAAGSYTFSGAATVGGRNPGATIFLPTEDEWYKAAYYDALSTSYFDFPAGSDVETVCTEPTALTNRANCFGSVGRATDVGSYAGSAAPTEPSTRAETGSSGTMPASARIASSAAASS